MRSKGTVNTVIYSAMFDLDDTTYFKKLLGSQCRFFWIPVFGYQSTFWIELIALQD
jgi:hypothetical protein